jgi:hypothetical protein
VLQGGGEVEALSTQEQYFRAAQVARWGFRHRLILILNSTFNEPGTAVRRWVYQDDDPRAVEFAPKDIGTDRGRDCMGRYLS